MKHSMPTAILILLMIVSGCAQKQQVRVTYLSDPPGGTLYKRSGELWGPCPKVLWYDLDAEALEKGYLDVQGLKVRWPAGPDIESGKLLRILVDGTDRCVVFTQPVYEPQASVDIANSQGSKTPVQKRAITEGPLESLAGLTLTLSEEQLVLLDWQRANRGGARVEGKRPDSGPGVEFEIYFPDNTPGNCSLSFVSTGEGGRGSLVGTDVRGYDTFALKLTLVSVNGRRDPAARQKLVAGAVIGPTATGSLTGYEPVTLSLAASERTVTAKTPMSTDEIYEIGFHIHALNHGDWDPSGSRVVLLVGPAER